MLTNDSFVPPSFTVCIAKPCGPMCDWNQEKMGELLSIDLKEFMVSRQIVVAQNILGSKNVFLASRSQLSAGREIYDRAATFLGVEAFPTDFSAVKANEQHRAKLSTVGLRQL